MVIHSSHVAAIFRRNLWVFGIFYVMMSTVLLYAALRSDPRLITLICINICIPPAFVIITYRECRTAWLCESPNELRDCSIPAVSIMATVVCLRFVVYGLLGS